MNYKHPTRIANFNGPENRADSARRGVFDRQERVTIWADPAKEGIRLCFVFHDPARYRRHDFLPVADRQADFAVEQALPALINADLSPTR